MLEDHDSSNPIPRVSWVVGVDRPTVLRDVWRTASKQGGTIDVGPSCECDLRLQPSVLLGYPRWCPQIQSLNVRHGRVLPRKTGFDPYADYVAGAAEA